MKTKGFIIIQYTCSVRETIFSPPNGDVTVVCASTGSRLVSGDSSIRRTTAGVSTVTSDAVEEDDDDVTDADLER